MQHISYLTSKDSISHYSKLSDYGSEEPIVSKKASQL